MWTGEEAVFTVSDDGPGMAPEMVENINNGVFPHEKEGRIHVGIANSYRRIHYFYGDRENFRWNPCRERAPVSRL